MLPILHQSLWRDEAFSVFIAGRPLNEIFLSVVKDVQGPLYYFILHYWMLFWGNSEVSIRSLSIILHLALGVLVLFFVHHLTNNLLASFLSALATIFNPFLIFYSFEARPYSLLAFLITLSSYLFLTKRYILSSMFMSLALITHNFALFYLLGVGIYWLFKKHKEIIGRNNTLVKETLSLFLLPAITMVVWGFFAIKQWGRIVESFWINATNSGVFLETFEKFFGGPVDLDGKIFLVTIAIILGSFVISSLIISKEKSHPSYQTVLVIEAITPIIASYIISSLWVPNFHERYVIASVPLLMIFATTSLYKLAINSSQNLSYLVISLVAIYTLGSIQLAEKIVRTPTKPPINYAVSEIIKKAGEGDIVTPREYTNFPEIKYYLKQKKSSLPVYALSPSGEIVWYANAAVIGEQEILRELPKNKRVWQVNPDGSYELKD